MKHRNSNTSRSSSNSNGSTSNDSPILESSIKIQRPNYNMLLKENRNDPKYKTELCKTFSEKGSCPYGSKCRFLLMERKNYFKRKSIVNYINKKSVILFLLISIVTMARDATSSMMKELSMILNNFIIRLY